MASPTEASTTLLDPPAASRPGGALLTLDTLLEKAGISAKSVVVFRHRPPEARLGQLLPSFAAERPELFAAYQSVQGGQAAAMLRGATVLASFIGQEGGRATFAGLFAIEASRTASAAEIRAMEHMPELIALGMPLAPAGGPLAILFTLTPLPFFTDWIGRLVIDWPARGINWKLRADRSVFPIRAIYDESRFIDAMPKWSELTLAWGELALLPQTWRANLAQWRGVYFIFDTDRKLGYVGSAAGGENILGRWRDYAASGHGGNVRLRESRPESLRFSILELTAPSLPIEEVIKAENAWKHRLHTRELGLNIN